MKNIMIYLRCLAANKVITGTVLITFLFFWVEHILFSLFHTYWIYFLLGSFKALIFFGAGILTQWGYETYRAYGKTMKRAHAHQTIDERDPIPEALCKKWGRRAAISDWKRKK